MNVYGLSQKGKYQNEYEGPQKLWQLQQLKADDYIVRTPYSALDTTCSAPYFGHRCRGKIMSYDRTMIGQLKWLPNLNLNLAILVQASVYEKLPSL